VRPLTDAAELDFSPAPRLCPGALASVGSAGVSPARSLGVVRRRVARWLLPCVVVAGCAGQATAAPAAGELAAIPLTPWSAAPALTHVAEPTQQPKLRAAAASAAANPGFEVNRGQWPSEVLFADHRASAITYFTRSGPVVVDHGRVLRMRFEAAATTLEVRGEGVSSAVTNYYVGNDRSKWHRNVPSVASVRYDDVWPGVDVRFRHTGGELEYDLLLAPGVTRTSFPVHLAGAGRIRHGHAGDLRITLGSQTLRQHALHGWEERPSGARRPVPVSFRIRGTDRISIELGHHDSTVPVVIDPILTYSTYLGGSEDDSGVSVAALPNGGAVVAGTTTSSAFPTAGGSVAAPNGTASDVFVTQLNSVGELVSTAYYGGHGIDEAVGVGVDADGDIVLGLQTKTSTDLPFTLNAPQKSKNSSYDAALARLDGATGDLRFATYFGGNSHDYPTALAVDAAGRAFITGYTFSFVFPTTDGAERETPIEGVLNIGDGFVAGIDTVSGDVLFATYLGGRYGSTLRSVASDGEGNSWVTGYTTSTGTSYPTTPGALHTALNGPADAVVTKLDGHGKIAFSTLLGGRGRDEGRGITVGPSGRVFVVGDSDSNDFPVTPDALQKPSELRSDNAFVTRWSADGGPAEFSTMLGGSADERAHAVVADSDDHAYVVGETTSERFPIKGAVQPTGGDERFYKKDGFASGIATTSPGLMFSTFLGGVDDDSLTGVALGAAGMLTVTGQTKSSDFITKAAGQPSAGGAIDAVVASFQLGDYDPPDTTLVSGPPEAATLNAATFAFSSPDGGDGTRFECSVDAETVYAACSSGATFRALPQGRHTFRARAIDASNNIDPTPAVYSWVIDATQPDTTISTSLPSITNQTTAEFRFDADQADATFECRLDDADFTPCDPVTSFAGLEGGTHTVEARATDPAGNTDTSPAAATWSVDLKPPTTALTNAPFAVATGTSASFGLATPDGSTFTCKLDDRPLTSCTDSVVYEDLPEGSHTFAAYAMDEAGNVDPTGARHTWRIETAPPIGRIDDAPAARTNKRTAVLAFSANEPASFECRLDSRPFSACTSPVTYTDLGEGSHNFQLRATDLSSKPDPNPPIVSWRVDLTPPSAPTLAEPADSARALTQTPSFAWGPATDRDSDIAAYTLLIDGNAATEVAASACTTTRCAAPAPSPLDHGPHVWAVRSADGAGNTTTSTPWPFDVDAAGPSAPDALGPVTDAVVLAAQAALRWQAATDPGSGMASYDVSIDGTVRATGLPAGATSWISDQELANGRHTWSITAVDRNGNRTTGAAGSFITDRTPPTATFTTVPPKPFYVNQTIRFDAGASVDPDGRIVTYAWDLDGDGQYEIRDGGPIVEHTYNLREAGSVAVSLLVIDQAGRETSATQVIELSSTRPGATIVSLAGRTDFTRFPKVNLRISPPSGATAMQISNDSGAFGSAETRPITKAVETVENWELKPFGDPARSNPTTTAAVYVTFLAGPVPLAGNYPGQIGVDNRPPIVTAPKMSTKGAFPLLKADVTDKAGSGVARVQVTTSKKQPGKEAFYELPPDSKVKLSVRVKFINKGKATGALEVKRGAKQIYLRVEDALGNRSDFVAVKITKSGRIQKKSAKRR
jgi:PKD domain/Beta-propeller repeat